MTLLELFQAWRRLDVRYTSIRGSSPYVQPAGTSPADITYKFSNGKPLRGVDYYNQLNKRDSILSSVPDVRLTGSLNTSNYTNDDLKWSTTFNYYYIKKIGCEVMIKDLTDMVTTYRSDVVLSTFVGMFEHVTITHVFYDSFSSLGVGELSGRLMSDYKPSSELEFCCLLFSVLPKTSSNCCFINYFAGLLGLIPMPMFIVLDKIDNDDCSRLFFGCNLILKPQLLGGGEYVIGSIVRDYISKNYCSASAASGWGPNYVNMAFSLPVTIQNNNASLTDCVTPKYYSLILAAAWERKKIFVPAKTQSYMLIRMLESLQKDPLEGVSISASANRSTALSPFGTLNIINNIFSFTNVFQYNMKSVQMITPIFRMIQVSFCIENQLRFQRIGVVVGNVDDSTYVNSTVFPAFNVAAGDAREITFVNSTLFATSSAYRDACGLTINSRILYLSGNSVYGSIPDSLSFWLLVVAQMGYDFGVNPAIWQGRTYNQNFAMGNRIDCDDFLSTLPLHIFNDLFVIVDYGVNQNLPLVNPIDGNPLVVSAIDNVRHYNLQQCLGSYFLGNRDNNMLQAIVQLCNKMGCGDSFSKALQMAYVYGSYSKSSRVVKRGNMFWVPTSGNDMQGPDGLYCSAGDQGCYMIPEEIGSEWLVLSGLAFSTSSPVVYSTDLWSERYWYPELYSLSFFDLYYYHSFPSVCLASTTFNGQRANDLSLVSYLSNRISNNTFTDEVIANRASLSDIWIHPEVFEITRTSPSDANVQVVDNVNSGMINLPVTLRLPFSLLVNCIYSREMISPTPLGLYSFPTSKEVSWPTQPIYFADRSYSVNVSSSMSNYLDYNGGDALITTQNIQGQWHADNDAILMVTTSGGLPVAINNLNRTNCVAMAFFVGVQRYGGSTLQEVSIMPFSRCTNQAYSISPSANWFDRFAKITMRLIGQRKMEPDPRTYNLKPDSQQLAPKPRIPSVVAPISITDSSDIGPVSVTEMGFPP